jgi:hypothetical protein
MAKEIANAVTPEVSLFSLRIINPPFCLIRQFVIITIQESALYGILICNNILK